jgi:hypothetical protein
MSVIKSKKWGWNGDVFCKLPLNTKLTPLEISLLQCAVEHYAKDTMQGTSYRRELEDLHSKLKVSFEIRIKDMKACGYYA